MSGHGDGVHHPIHHKAQVTVRGPVKKSDLQEVLASEEIPHDAAVSIRDTGQRGSETQTITVEWVTRT